MNVAEEPAAHSPQTAVRELYFFIATANVAQIHEKIAESKRDSSAALLLHAVLAQYDGRVDRALQLFEKALSGCDGGGRAYVIDLIAPILVMRNAWERYDDLRRSVGATTELEGCFLAFDAVSLARSGSKAASISVAAQAEAGVNPPGNEFLRARILQRVAHAAYERADFETAMEQALQSAATFEAISAGRSAAASYSIVYNVFHAVSGDLESADAYARKIVETAQLSGDRSFMMSGLVAQYEIASELGDRARAEALRKEITAFALPKQYQERFARGIADLLVLAAAGDFFAFRANVVLLRDSVICDRSMIALTSALRSLAKQLSTKLRTPGDHRGMRWGSARYVTPMNRHMQSATAGLHAPLPRVRVRSFGITFVRDVR